MMVGKSFRIDQLGALPRQAFLEALRLRNPAQRSYFAPFDEVQAGPFTRKNILEIKRVMNALDDASCGVVFADARPEGGGVAIAFGDENRAGARKMRGWLAQSAARQKVLVPER